MSFVAAAIIGGSAITAGAGIYSASQNKGAPGIAQKYTPGPYAEQGKTAVNDWLGQLTKDQNDPNWGAISPDWNDIWQQTQQHVNNYYNGTATSPGVNDQIKASFAQRGMSGDPAASYLTAASGADQAQQLGNLEAQQNVAKQTFANTGKNNWMANIASFQHETAPQQGAWSNSVPYATSGQQIGNAIGSAGSGLASYGIQQQSNQNQLNWLQQMNQNPTSYGDPYGLVSAYNGVF